MLFQMWGACVSNPIWSGIGHWGLMACPSPCPCQGSVGIVPTNLVGADSGKTQH